MAVYRLNLTVAYSSGIGDVWMQPGLVASHPEASEAFTNYRVAKYAQAQENIQTAVLRISEPDPFSLRQLPYSLDQRTFW